MRLFVAVDLPEAVKGSLDTAVLPLRSALPPARWVRQTGFHLTLAFLGEVEGERVGAITRALRGMLEQEGGFRAHFSGLGSFPNAGPVRVVWAGLEPAARFSRLAERVQDALRLAAVPFDDKPFRSHITLARCTPHWPGHARTQIGELAEGLGESLAGQSFACDHVTLFSSVLAPGGATYSVEAEVSLQAP
jgi:2'-5' RNA ligase